MALIFFLSHQPTLPTPALFPGQDKMFHAITFGILGAFYLGSMHKPVAGYTLTQIMLASLCVAAYGGSDELHQHFVPGRTADVWDLLADTAGGLLVTTALWLVVRRKKG